MSIPYKSSIILRALPPLLAILFITGCKSTQECEKDEQFLRVDSTPHANLVNQAKQDWSWIAGTTWIVTSIEGQAPLPGTDLWIRFQDHTWMSGSAGCNHISASYERRGIDGLQISKIAGTKMHCPQPQGAMQQESRFIHILSNIDAYQPEENTLNLSTNAVTMLTFKKAPSQSDD